MRGFVIWFGQRKTCRIWWEEKREKTLCETFLSSLWGTKFSIFNLFLVLFFIILILTTTNLCGLHKAFSTSPSTRYAYRTQCESIPAKRGFWAGLSFHHVSEQGKDPPTDEEGVGCSRTVPLDMMEFYVGTTKRWRIVVRVGVSTFGVSPNWTSGLELES